MKRIALLICTLLWLGTINPARADQPGENASQEQTSASKPAKPKVEAGIEIRFRNEWRDNADFQPAEDFDHFTGQRIRGFLRLKLHPDFTFYIQGQDVWLYGAERDKIIHDLSTNLHQAYFDWQFSPQPWTLRVGRQEFNYGRQRLVGGFGWDNVGRSFDGARLRYQKGRVTVDGLWGRLVEIRRRGGRSRPGNLDLSGAYVTLAPKNSVRRLEIYGFFLRDSLRTGGEQGRAPETTRIGTVGLRTLRAPATGFRYEYEMAVQFGTRGPDSHGGLALVANSGYVWDARFQPLLQFEYVYAQGDDNAADGRSREFHNLFPTNHLHYGYADLEGLRNLHDFRVTASARFLPKLTATVDYHNFLLASRRGPWKNAGGRVLGFDPTGQSGRHVGQEMDFTFRIPVHPHLSFTAGYSAFFPGTFAKRTRGSETHHFGYLQTVVRF